MKGQIHVNVHPQILAWSSSISAVAISPVTRAEAAATALALVASGSGVAALLHDEDGSLASLVGLGLAATAAAGGE